MSFLKKLGEVLAIASSEIVGIGPLVIPLFGNKSNKVEQRILTTATDLTSIGSVVLSMEVALAGKTGADKLAGATNLVGPIIRTSQLVAGKKIADEAMMQKGIAEVTQGMVDILNSLHENSISKEVKVP